MNKISIRFILIINRQNNEGKAPLFCRLTYLKRRKQFSTGLFINPIIWNSKQQVAEPPDDNSDYINSQMSLIINNINQAFLMLKIGKQPFDVDDIFTLYNGDKLSRDYYIVEYFDLFLDKLKKLIGLEIKEATWLKFHYVKNNLQAFIKWNFKKNDLPLKKLNLHFLTEFDYYLKVVKAQKQITINKTIQRFRKPIKVAVSEGYLDKDPFLMFKSKRARTEIIFLEIEELKSFEKYEFVQPRLQLVQDWFVFSCYTGLAYNELKKLSKKHIVKGFDNQYWIHMKREKTQKELAIPILPKAQKLIDKYCVDNRKIIFQLMSNQMYNSLLKEMAILIGIDKRITTHTARKTFASTVLLFNNVPMEIVSELLGHSSITVTEESYGKVVRKNVSLAIEKLNKTLKP